MVNEKILIVEDEFYTFEGLKVILARAKYSPIPEVARSYQEAMVLVEKHKPDLILMDIRIEGDKSGIDVARDLQGSNIPIIFLTAYSSDEILAEALKTQPYGYIIKPITSVKELKPTIELAFSKVRAQQIDTNNNITSTKLNIQMPAIIDEIFQKENFESILEFYSTLANNIRLKILMHLFDEIHGFNEVCKSVEKAAGTVSHHLSKLEEKKLVIIEKQGKSSKYSFNKSIYPYLTALFNRVQMKTLTLDSIKLSFSAYANSDRLEIIHYLQEKSGTTDNFASILNKSAGTISRHLSLLKRANLVEIAHNVKPIKYKLNPDTHMKYLSIYQESL